ncbi:translation initiation factor IF-2-like [Zalophus californianus]|uniref:Translation initiation factor IF-2-like n=1 Tax=Zalophus californianus TaxID=9704 RepID=A0A6J2EB12_ZALCA|nr:translation initiation factor IF-2-like [Zalophus californianus]
MVATRLFEATGPPARQRVQGTCLGLGDRPTPGDLRTKPAPAGSAPQPGTPQRLVPGRPGQTSLLRPATHEALSAHPPSAPRPEQALTKGLAEEAAPTGRGALRGRTRARCGAERGRAAGPNEGALRGLSPCGGGCPPSCPAPARGPAPRRCAHRARWRPLECTGLRPAARVQARGPSPRLWLPARAPHSPRSARARLSAVFAFAFLPPSLRKMKVTVAVARARAAAVEERGEESGGGRRGACELGPPPAPEEVAARPGLLYPAKQSPGWTAEKQENGLPAAVGNVPEFTACWRETASRYLRSSVVQKQMVLLIYRQKL